MYYYFNNYLMILFKILNWKRKVSTTIAFKKVEIQKNKNKITTKSENNWY